MVDAGAEADGGGLVWVLVGELDVEAVEAGGVGRVGGAVEDDVEFLHIVIHQGHVIVAQHPIVLVCISI